MKDIFIFIFIFGWLIGYTLGNAVIYLSGFAWRAIRSVRK